jgi:hypothetical protein
MTRPITTPEEFADEINRHLPDHDCYTQALQMFLLPRGQCPAKPLVLLGNRAMRATA